MKTKNKMIAMAEIAIVLCSLFLVALPAIAAEQSTQEVSAKTITTASEDDYVLGVYGNANEDDTIDMRDLTYVKLIFFGKKPETELADAKFDGKINPLDFIQTKLIIVGKERELTIVDGSGETVTVEKPVERIIVLMRDSADVLRALDADDEIVGVTKHIQDENVYYPELSTLPSVGASWGKLDYEAVLNLNPDVVMAFAAGYVDEEKLPGVTVLFLGLRFPEHFIEGVQKLGYILDKKEEAKEFIKWYEGWGNEIESRTVVLSDGEKPRVFNWAFFKPGGGYMTVSRDNRIHQMCATAGGKDIAEDLPYTSVWITVDAEWVIEQNPSIIVAQAYSAYTPCGYGMEDSSEMASSRADILNRPELGKVIAVESESVYMMDFLNLASSGSGCLVGTAYMAKWFHPDLFEDLDPRAIHQEYLTRFQHLDYDLDKHGVFVYPPLES